MKVAQMDTLFKDLAYAARGLRKNLGFAAVATDHDRARHRRLHRDLQRRQRRAAAAAAVRRRAAPGDWSGASCGRATSTTGRSRRRTSAICSCSPPRVFDELAGMIPAGRTPLARRRRRARADPRRRRHAEPLPRARRAHARSAAISSTTMRTPQPQPPQPGRRRRRRPRRRGCRPSRSSATRSGMRRYGGDPAVVGKDVDLGNGRAQHRRRARARLRAAVSAARATSSACPTCGRRRASTSRPRTATTSRSASSDG